MENKQAVSKTIELQQTFLNTLRKDSTKVTIFLGNGVRLDGVIASFDAYAVLLVDEKKNQHMIYKHFISTIAPSKPVALHQNKK